jgi:hypothetical protein
VKFSANNVAFGRHETFHLRFAWLSKGFSALQKDQTLFENTDKATVTLGVGKNMVSAIRYWLRATQLIDVKTDEPTEIGSYIFDSVDGVDPFLEDQGTLWLIHWLLATNTELATTIAWFFSKYHKTSFDQSELRAALSNFLQDEVKSTQRPAGSTLKNDVSVITRLYAKTQGISVAEDALDSPLSELGLMSEHGKSSYISTFESRDDLPYQVLGFAILQLLEFRKTKIVPIEDLINSAEDYVSPGSVFRLSESSFMVKLEELVRQNPSHFELRETAGLRQLFLLEPLADLELLKAYYSQDTTNVEAAA